MTWSLETKEGKILEPLQFSNNKTQEDVVHEVLQRIKEGNKIIFMRGVCGSGKSAVALNVAKSLGKSSVVVPVKYLQQQYENDYMHKLTIKKDNDKQLKITILTGRNNHKCLYNTSCTADDKFLPCHIRIKKENIDMLRLYMKENPFIEEKDVKTIEDIRRMSVAPACPFWSPIMGKEWANKGLKDAEVYEYKGLRDKRYLYHKRKPGCTYYEQFMSYITADVLVFNAKKYELETVMDRKPATEIEIIDECDEFLDSLGNEQQINFGYLLRVLEDIIKDAREDTKDVLEEIRDIARSISTAKWIEEQIEHNEILKLAL